MKKQYQLFGLAATLACLLLASCNRYDALRAARIAISRDPAAAAESVARSKAVGYALNPATLKNDLASFKKIIESFSKSVKGKWGDRDFEIASPKRYVKYTQDYQSRALVNFDTGIVTVETLDTKTPLESLHQAIVITLLTPNDPRSVDLYSSKPIELGSEPFLYNEVVDNDGKSIRWEWRANRYADYLLRTGIAIRKNNKGAKIYTATIPMISDHLHVRAEKFKPYVMNAANRFNVSPNLVYAIMKVESDFNPFAISSAMAIGLMQVVQRTAGGDVYSYLHGKKGYPSRNALINPETNTTYGTAYLHLLKERFLAKVKNPVSKEYCVIASYNGGAGNVLKTFNKNKSTAFSKINAMTPDQVYSKLRAELPYQETRRYLYKVLNAKKEFVNFK